MRKDRKVVMTVALTIAVIFFIVAAITTSFSLMFPVIFGTLGWLAAFVALTVWLIDHKYRWQDSDCTTKELPHEGRHRGKFQYTDRNYTKGW